ncbi:MAG: ribonuclease III [Candidatus Shapirobacteria bacterium]
MKSINLLFKNHSLWEHALTHRSYLNETGRGRSSSNERLEFLGDAVLSFIVSWWLYQRFTAFPEGKLTSLRSQLVKTETLARLAEDHRLGERIKMGRGEKEAGGGKNKSLLANCFEAVIGALFLDQGSEVVKKVVLESLEPVLEDVIKTGVLKDNKSLLQERLQAKGKKSPRYQVLKTKGPDHAKIFTMGVFHQKELLAQGEGLSKQIAEEAAAKIALEKIRAKK